jgi:hypothetical protein
MINVSEPAGITALAVELDLAHDNGVQAAVAGLQDPGLGAARLTGSAVPTLAEAAISSATPFLRAPLLSRLSAGLRLHPPAGSDGRCPSCREPAPCRTAKELQW